MATDDRQGTKVSKTVQKEAASGTRVDPYPYLGIVKNNVDPIRAGRVQVYISDFGGDPNEPKNWRTISYSSPFMGSTNTPTGGSQTNSWQSTSHSYGMQMSPPDIGVEVLVIFLGGDPNKGYFFGCVNSNISRHMMPGLAGSTNVDATHASGDIASLYKAATNANGGVAPAVPVAEFNNNATGNSDNPAFVNLNKPIHETQYKVIVNQGLDRDTARGIHTSSGQRESPSNVFGISTPGRAVSNPSTDQSFAKDLTSGTLSQQDYAVQSRQGGHTLVLDDGDATGGNQLVRLRSATGHQILMNDSDNTLYVANNTGDVWLEFTAEGKISLYSTGGIDIRSKGSMNIHSDSDINYNAVGNFNLKAEQNINFECVSMGVNATSSILVGSASDTQIHAGGNFNAHAGGGLSLKAGGILAMDGTSSSLQNGASVAVTPPVAMVINEIPDTQQSSGIWVQTPNTLRSIVANAPSHEPSFRPTPLTQGGLAAQPAWVMIKARGPQDTSTSTPGTFTGAVGTVVDNPITPANIRNQPLSNISVGPLSKEDTTALFAQMANNASPAGIGRYDMSVQSLRETGLVKSSVNTVGQLDIDSNWINGSKSQFIGNQVMQQQIVESYTQRTYNQLSANGVINELNVNSQQEVAGWLSVAHALGADGALAYATDGSGGSTAASLFQQGKYAMTLSPNVSSIMGG